MRRIARVLLGKHGDYFKRINNIQINNGQR